MSYIIDADFENVSSRINSIRNFAWLYNLLLRFTAISLSRSTHWRSVTS